MQSDMEPRATEPTGPQSGPNEVWTVSLKNWWRTSDGKRCDCLMVRDRSSRHILCLRPIERHRTDDAKQVFTDLFEKYGLPVTIRAGGSPLFFSRLSPYGLTRLNAWWRTLGIRTESVDPDPPEPLTASEWLPKDIANKVMRRQPGTLAEEIETLERWRKEHNERLASAAAGPDALYPPYKPSPRRLADVPPYPYPAEFGRRRVRRDGCVLINSRYLYVSEALGRLHVALEKMDDTGWRVWFCDLLVREVDSRQGYSRRPPQPSSACTDDPPAEPGSACACLPEPEPTPAD